MSRNWPTTGRKLNSRRGIALILVLGLVAIGMAVAYTMMRAQVSNALIQSNAQRRNDARQVAMEAAGIALRLLQDDSWQGFGNDDSQVITGIIDSEHHYQVTLAAGDYRLDSTSAEYSRSPLRVSISAQGRIVNPTNDGIESSHMVRVVVELIPRQLPAEPIGWDAQDDFSVWQYAVDANSKFQVELPIRIRGRIRIFNRLDLCLLAPGVDSIRTLYLQGLNQMRQSNGPEFRPFTDDVVLPAAQSDAATIAAIQDSLQLNVIDTGDCTHATTLADYDISSQAQSYRLYPKGKLYSAQNLGSQLQNVSLTADPATNPLGLFFAPGDLSLGTGVVIRGTLIVLGNLTMMAGTNDLEGIDFPALAQTTAPIRLPSLIVGGNLTVQSQVSSDIRGIVFVGGRFWCPGTGQDDISFRIRGRLIAKEFLIEPRTEFRQTSSWWTDRETEYSQLATALTFPEWLQSKYGLNYQPNLRFGTRSMLSKYHWRKSSDTLYVPHPADGAGTTAGLPSLRFAILDWRDVKQNE